MRGRTTKAVCHGRGKENKREKFMTGTLGVRWPFFLFLQTKKKKKTSENLSLRQSQTVCDCRCSVVFDIKSRIKPSARIAGDAHMTGSAGMYASPGAAGCCYPATHRFSCALYASQRRRTPPHMLQNPRICCERCYITDREGFKPKTRRKIK